MKCSKECDGWKFYPVRIAYKESPSDSISTRVPKYCLHCGSPLTEEPKMITRTVEYPEPMKERPERGTIVFIPRLDNVGPTYNSLVWIDHAQECEIWFSRGIYPTADLAIQRAKAMIGEG